MTLNIPQSLALSLVAVLACASAVAQTAGATYSEAVGPLIERKCVHCHRPGGVAPMAFMSYEDTREWAKKSYTPLDALLRTRAMPPWPADPAVGEFANEEFMSPGEIELLLAWISAGLPRGDGEYRGPAPAGEWSGGEPGHVIELPEYTVPEEVVGEYRTIPIATSFPEDRWIVASEVRPGNPYAVRAITAGALGTYQTGQFLSRYPAPYAMFLEQGATLEVTVRYLKEEGVEETDRSRIGLYFAPDSSACTPIHEAPMRAEPFTIPAGSAAFEVITRFTFPSDGEIVALMPVMHARGKRVDYTLTLPGGGERKLLSIPEWNPNWKYRYVLRKPIAAPKGSVVTATAVFDNSEANLKNPDPWSDVDSGPAGETFEGWMSYALGGPSN